MEYILLLGIFEAVFLAMLLFTKKNKSLPDNILGTLFMLYAITIMLSLAEAYNRKNGYPFPYVINLAPCLIILHGPALWFYIKSQTDQHFRFRPVYLLHFIPFAIMAADFAYRQLSMSNEQMIEITGREIFKNYLTYKVFVSAIAISSTSYYIWGLVLIRQYNLKIRNYFSHTEEFDLQWLRILLIATLITYSIINLFFIADLIFNFMAFSILQPASFVLASVYILFLGFYGHKQSNVFTSSTIAIDLDKTVETAVNQPPINQTEEKFVYDLLDFMKTGKPFCDPDLTVAKLSDMLKVTPEHLSSVLNGRLNRNFFDFVNYYRVEEFKLRCTDVKNQNFTLIGIAYDCGFNSKATFNRVFKKQTGLTPSDYKSGFTEK